MLTTHCTTRLPTEVTPTFLEAEVLVGEFPHSAVISSISATYGCGTCTSHPLSSLYRLNQLATHPGPARPCHRSPPQPPPAGSQSPPPGHPRVCSHRQCVWQGVGRAEPGCRGAPHLTGSAVSAARQRRSRRGQTHCGVSAARCCHSRHCPEGRAGAVRPACPQQEDRQQQGTGPGGRHCSVGSRGGHQKGPAVQKVHQCNMHTHGSYTCAYSVHTFNIPYMLAPRQPAPDNTQAHLVIMCTA